jgi:hypothetical protein
MSEKHNILKINYMKNRKILKNQLVKIVNEINLNKKSNKNLIINKIKCEYENKLKELNNKYENKFQELNNEIKAQEEEDKIKTKQYNLENYDLIYDSKFDEIEVETIFEELVKKNISHVKKWYNEFKYITLPNYSALVEIKNGIVNTLDINKKDNSLGGYELRLLPFLEYIKKINLENINIKFIVIYCDNINCAEVNEKTNYDIPILCSSISNDCKKKYNNLVLIPNLYYYLKDGINIKEIKMVDIDYKDKTKSINFTGCHSNLERINFAKWVYEKKNSSITCNLRDFLNCYEIEKKYYNKFLSKEDQLKNKFLVSFDGCSTAWDGLIWKLYSNSLVLKLNQEYYEYWYSLLDRENVIFKCNNFEEMENIMETIQYDSELVKEMLVNKKKVAKIIMDDDFNKRYIREILLNLTAISEMN